MSKHLKSPRMDFLVHPSSQNQSRLASQSPAQVEACQDLVQKFVRHEVIEIKLKEQISIFGMIHVINHRKL